MTPEQFKAARLQLQTKHGKPMTQDKLAAVLDYEGPHKRAEVSKMESGDKSVSKKNARLMKAYLSGYRPDDWPE